MIPTINSREENKLMTTLYFADTDGHVFRDLEHGNGGGSTRDVLRSIRHSDELARAWPVPALASLWRCLSGYSRTTGCADGGCLSRALSGRRTRAFCLQLTHRSARTSHLGASESTPGSRLPAVQDFKLDNSTAEAVARSPPPYG